MRAFFSESKLFDFNLETSSTFWIELAQHKVGKFFLILFFAFFFVLSGAAHSHIHNPLEWQEYLTFHPYQVAIIGLFLMSFFPNYRRHWLLIINFFIFLYWSGHHNLWRFAKHLFNLNSMHQVIGWTHFQYIVLLTFIIFNIAFIYTAVRFRNTWFMKHPIVLLTLLLLLGADITYHSTSIFMKMFFSSLCSLETIIFWFMAYSLLNVKLLASQPIWKKFAHYFPFWGSTMTPYPKGSSYLDRIEAKNSEELAISQLSGLKLIVWAVILKLLLTKIYFYQTAFHIPGFENALNQISQHHYFSRSKYWLILFFHFSDELIKLSIMGHIIISACRMAGFNALRNTYKPLLATTIADFWNRYYFYFKELLVEVFFYPTYFRYFKNYSRLRILFATLTAACFGNFIYHYIRSINVIYKAGLLHLLVNMQGYAFYTLILASSIGISQLRKNSKNTITFFSQSQIIFYLRKYFTTPGIVIGFFALLSVFNQPGNGKHLINNLQFVYHLFF